MTPQCANNNRSRRSSVVGGLRKSIAKTRQSLRASISLRRVKKTTSKSVDDRKVEYVLDNLSAEEVETAARASYEYLIEPHASQQEFHARRMIERVLRSKKDENKALKLLKDTLRFREEIDIDNLRLAFSSEGHKYQTPLKNGLASEKLFVHGFDREGRSTYHFVPHKVNHHDAEWTLKEHVYTLERAIACSRAEDRSVNAIVDFRHFSAMRHAPPTHIGKEFMTTFRNHYAGAINQIFIVDAPTTFFCLWAVFKPFIGKKTRDRIHIVKSSSPKIREWYEVEELPKWLGGKKDRSLNIDEYLHEVAFDHAFDE